jgi:class 3 adenylate cyclase
VEKALDYARELQANPGHAQVSIRAGIHIGPMQVEEDDVFGGAVNFAARVVGAIEQRPEIWLSDRAKEDLDRSGSGQRASLKWKRHDGLHLKGFTGDSTLWSLSK